MITSESGIAGDVWAIGVLLCVLFLGYMPLGDEYVALASSADIKDRLLEDTVLPPTYAPTSRADSTDTYNILKPFPHKQLVPISHPLVLNSCLSYTDPGRLHTGGDGPDMWTDASMTGGMHVCALNKPSKASPLLTARLPVHTLSDMLTNTLMDLVAAGASAEFVELVGAMLDIDTKTRPTVPELLQHPMFLQTHDSEQLQQVKLLQSDRAHSTKAKLRWKLIRGLIHFMFLRLETHTPAGHNASVASMLNFQ